MAGGILIFLVPSLEQPRIIKRIVEKSESYDEIKVLAFTRKIHQVNNFQKLSEIENVDIRIIDSFSDRKYISRIMGYCKLLIHLFWKFGVRKKRIYTFGLDLRLISFFIPNAKTDYEISDILWLYKSGVIRVLLRRLDFFLTKRSSRVYFTSEGFYKRYYNFLNPEKAIVLENKFKSYGKVFPLESIKQDKIRIAYVGAFRYNDIIEALLEVCEKSQDLVLNFYGDGPEEIISKIKKISESHSNINYSGPFRNPDDLQKIYSENNLNFVAYDNKLENERVAMPNKFYESGFFNIPIVCSDYTFVGEKVKEYAMGWTINPTKNGIAAFLNSLTTAQLFSCHENIKTLNKTLFET